MSKRALLRAMVAEALVERALEGKAAEYVVKDGGVPLAAGHVRGEAVNRGVKFTETQIPRGVLFNFRPGSVVVWVKQGEASENAVDERRFRV